MEKGLKVYPWDWRMRMPRNERIGLGLLLGGFCSSKVWGIESLLCVKDGSDIELRDQVLNSPQILANLKDCPEALLPSNRVILYAHLRDMMQKAHLGNADVAAYLAGQLGQMPIEYLCEMCRNRVCGDEAAEQAYWKYRTKDATWLDFDDFETSYNAAVNEPEDNQTASVLMGLGDQALVCGGFLRIDAQGCGRSHSDIKSWLDWGNQAYAEAADYGAGHRLGLEKVILNLYGDMDIYVELLARLRNKCFDVSPEFTKHLASLR